MVKKYYSPILYHSGILGMKWGVRRYQNEDGTLTEAGKERYAKLNRKIDRQRAKIQRSKNKLDKYYKNRGVKVSKMKAKAAKMTNRAYNGLFLSDKKRAELKFKAERLAAKADKMAANSLKYEAKVRRGEAKVNKYLKQLEKLQS